MDISYNPEILPYLKACLKSQPWRPAWEFGIQWHATAMYLKE